MTTERRQALKLAVAVMMLFVRGSVGNPHHQPGDDGRDHVDRGVQGLGDQRETADGDADREFGRGHAGAGEDRDRGDCGIFWLGAWAVMRGGLAGRPLTSSGDRRRNRHSLAGAICCELFFRVRRCRVAKRPSGFRQQIRLRDFVAVFARGFWNFFLHPPIGGRGEYRAPNAPRQKVEKCATVTPAIRHSPRNGLSNCFVSPRRSGSFATVTCGLTPNLTPPSRCQVHTTWPSALA